MNLPQVYMCSPSLTLLPPLSPYHPSGLSQCTSPKHPVSFIEPGPATHFIHDIIHISMNIFSGTLTILRMTLYPDPMGPTKTGKAILNGDIEIHKII